MVPFEKQSITVIRQSKVGVDTSYEPPLRVGSGNVWLRKQHDAFVTAGS